MEAIDPERRHRLWLASLDRLSPPRQIPNVQGEHPLYGVSGEIFFRAGEWPSFFVYSVREDGTGLRKAIEQPIRSIRGRSPEGQWLLIWATITSEEAGATQAFPVGGGHPVRVYSNDARLKWSLDGRAVFFSVGGVDVMGSGAAGRTYVIPLPPGRVLPEIPAGGFRSEAEIGKLPGVRVIDSPDVAPWPDA